MKPTAYLINTSRGSNIDQQALYKALKKAKSLAPQQMSTTKSPKLKVPNSKTNSKNSTTS